MNEGGALVDRTVEFATASTVTLANGAPSQGFLDLTNDRDVTLADVNGDDRLDVITAVTTAGPAGHAMSHPRVYINQGQLPGAGWLGLIFDDEFRIPPMPDEPRFHGVGAGDVDNDGDVDLYFADADVGPYPRTVDVNDRLLANNGSGYFTDVSASAMTPQMLNSSFGVSAAIADFNGDGVLDVMTTDHFASHVTIAYNSAASPGQFVAYEAIIGGAPEYAAAGDLNNDGRLDIVVTDHGSDRYYLNQGNGADGLANFAMQVVSFTPPSADDGFGGEAVLADLNNDAYLDAIVSDVDEDVAGCNRRAHVFRNHANTPNVTIREELIGGAVAAIPTNQLTGTHDVAVFDIDGDNGRDLVLGRCIGLRVMMNVTPGIACACAGDVNGDSLRDGRDVDAFVGCLLDGGGACACADANADGSVAASDVPAFAAALVAGAGACP
jgi:hypothetical protein